jgi:hypothetical protein
MSISAYGLSEVCEIDDCDIGVNVDARGVKAGVETDGSGVGRVAFDNDGDDTP